MLRLQALCPKSPIASVRPGYVRGEDRSDILSEKARLAATRPNFARLRPSREDEVRALAAAWSSRQRALRWPMKEVLRLIQCAGSSRHCQCDRLIDRLAFGN